MKWILASAIPLAVAAFTPPNVALLKSIKPLRPNSAFPSPRVTTSKIHVAPENDDVAVCWEGGGFLAHSVHTGLTAGLLCAAEKYGICSNTKLHNDSGDGKPALLDRVKNLVTNSGGVWYSSQLIFSDFAENVEQMAGGSFAALMWYQGVFTQPWMDTFTGAIGSEQESLVNTLVFVVEAYLASQNQWIIRKDLRATLRMLVYFIYFGGGSGEGFTWNNVVDTMLSSTSSLNPTDTMNTAPREWSKGKNWIVNTAIITSPTSVTASNEMLTDFRVWQTNLSTPIDLLESSRLIQANKEGEDPPPAPIRPDEIISYTSDHRDDGSPDYAQIYYPSQFSVVLGDAKADPPLPIAHNLGSATFTYKGTSPDGDVTSEAEINMEYPAGSQGDLPISDVAACSSAFIGGNPYVPDVMDTLAQYLEGDIPMWISGAASTQNAFKDARDTITKIRAEKQVTQALVDELAAKKVFGIIDGGYWDNTGVINAIAAGSKEIYFFSDTQSNATTGEYDLHQFEALFKPQVGLDSMVYHQIFEQQDIVSKINDFEVLHNPNTSSLKKVEELKVGTVEARTIDNPMVGITAGTDVKIHVLSVASPFSIGLFIDFNRYAELVGEIVEILTHEKNSESVKGMLNSLVVGLENSFPGDNSA